tara:strand:- start:922 stop:1629 length:708 start_codon:yes stop_codon:yes gene_type:complete
MIYFQNLIKSTFLLATSLIMSGCAIGSMVGLIEFAATTERHQVQMLSDPQLKELSKKIWFADVDDMPASYLFITEKPTENEKVTIMRFYELRKQQAIQEIDLLNKNAGSGLFKVVANTGTTALTEYLNEVMNLYLGNLTYGEFNRLDKSIDERATQKIKTYQANSNAETNASNARNAAAYSPDFGSIAQPMHDSMNKLLKDWPKNEVTRDSWQEHRNGRTLQCNRWGTQVTCQQY